MIEENEKFQGEKESSQKNKLIIEMTIDRFDTPYNVCEFNEEICKLLKKEEE